MIYHKKKFINYYLKFIYILVFIILIFTLNSCGKKPIEQKRTANLKQDNKIKVYFNNNLAKDANYTDSYRNVTRAGDDLEKIIINQINSAQSTIDIAVQELNLPNIAIALAQKQKEGVKIRVILENNYSDSLGNLSTSEVNNLDSRNMNKYEEYKTLIDINKDGNLSNQEINQRDALKILENSNIPVIDDTADGTKGSGLMHHKFIVIDGSKIVTGSANFTLSGIHGDFKNLETRGNANHLLEIDSYEIAQAFISEFNLMWGDGVGGKQDSKFGVQKPLRKPQTFTIDNNIITLNFSPISPSKNWEDSSNALIKNTLKNATKSIDLALFVFSEQKIADTLNNKNLEGIQIRTLIDSSFIFQNYSEALDMLGVTIASKKCEAEKNNNPWISPIKTVGVAKLIKGDKLHHKFALIDQDTVITGSHNWSASANNNNDETLLIIQNIVVANHFKAEFNHLYETAYLGISPKLKDKLEQQKKRCPNFN